MNRHCGFRSFFLGGFECSSYTRPCGTRVDLLSSTDHDRWAELDYQRLQSIGIRTARDGVRWHLIEQGPYRYQWSSFLPMLRAAQDTGIQVIWDLCHYGWPDDLDVFRPEFVERFRAFARAVASVVVNESDGAPYFAPVNEISFLAWGAGDKGILTPFARGRGFELKCQLVRACIAAIEAIRDVAPHARFVQVDPAINVVADAALSEEKHRAAKEYTRAQYDGYELLRGNLWPQIGGGEQYLDIIGANYYVHNQWVLDGKFIERTDPRYRPLHELLGEIYTRYKRPLFVAETGIEDDRRPEWLAYVCDEVVTAMEAGIPIEGICLYPIVNHPGWVDDRHCYNGLWDYCNDCGHREIYKPLADELSRQAVRIETARRRLAERAPIPAMMALTDHASVGASV